jgi:sporulation protein YlmC with PRC-barrel domain
MRQLTPLLAAAALLIAAPVFAQTTTTPSATAPAPAPATAPASDSMSVTAYYKQNVYDNDNNKIGQIGDVLIGKDGKIENLVIGAGGFLGMGKHDVLVPFSSVKMVREDQTPRNDPKAKNRDRARGDREARNDYRLVMNTTKDALKNQPGYKYDRTAMTWVRDDSSKSNSNSNNTTGRRNTR